MQMLENDRYSALHSKASFQSHHAGAGSHHCMDSCILSFSVIWDIYLLTTANLSICCGRWAFFFRIFSDKFWSSFTQPGLLL
mmetsp:Transcript_12897/g.18791  ORF Transcript_12897/g.18791 Transcript_12897/m.18791 type:complete len:82 (-) Transcript_12897:127-372(-)